MAGAQFEVVDLRRQTAREIVVPTGILLEPGRSWDGKPKYGPAELVGRALDRTTVYS